MLWKQKSTLHNPVGRGWGGGGGAELTLCGCALRCVCYELVCVLVTYIAFLGRLAFKQHAKCISGICLPRQLDMLPHWDGSCRSDWLWYADTGPSISRAGPLMLGQASGRVIEYQCLSVDWLDWVQQGDSRVPMFKCGLIRLGTAGW